LNRPINSDTLWRFGSTFKKLDGLIEFPNQNSRKRYSSMIKRLILLLLLISLSSSVFAQRFNKQDNSYGARDSRFESSFVLAFQNGMDYSVEGGGSIDVDSSLGWGITLGWNWTEHWNLSYKLTLNNPGYTAVIVPEDTSLPAQTLDYKMSKGTHMLNATYNFRDKPFTPYIQAGVGVTVLDSNVPDSPPTTGCWWDPWWGYICSTTWSTYKKTAFAYNIGLGLRWDVNNALFFKGAYNKEWVSVKSGTLSFDTLSVEGGLMF
jgi:opacity protein-like surface antigen